MPAKKTLAELLNTASEKCGFGMGLAYERGFWEAWQYTRAAVYRGKTAEAALEKLIKNMKEKKGR